MDMLPSCVISKVNANLTAVGLLVIDFMDWAIMYIKL